MEGQISKYVIPKRGQTVLLLHEACKMYYCIQDTMSGQTILQGFLSYNPQTDQVKHLFQNKQGGQVTDTLLEEMTRCFFVHSVSG